MHPAFGNSFDWHSSVHMHWLLTQLLEAEYESEGVDAPWAQQALTILTEHLSPANLEVEAAYMRANPSWERPYGWAWAAELASALHTSHLPQLHFLAANAAVLAEAVFDLTLNWLDTAPAPVRHGLHTNTAFGLRRIRRAAVTLERNDVVDGIDAAARRFFSADCAWPFHFERSGHDFLSAGLCEADLMLDVFSSEELETWLPAFLSELSPDSEVLTPLTVLDPTDGHQSHLYGLGLTVAASLTRISRALEPHHPDRAAAYRSAIPALMAPGLEAAVSDEYMSSHWIATFAWEALREASRNVPGCR